MDIFQCSVEQVGGCKPRRGKNGVHRPSVASEDVCNGAAEHPGSGPSVMCASAEALERNCK